jgi:Uma2 family endonuclease
MTAHRRRSAAPTRDLLAERRQAPDYVPPPPAPVSWDDFLAWLDEDTFAEWVDGEIVEMSPASDEHQFILGFLYRLLMHLVDEGLPGAVYLAPFPMRLTSHRTGREPDLLFVRAQSLSRAKRTYIDGPADLVVEIVSPESADRDHRVKLAEYEAAGVPEYWIIDPLQQSARFYLLGDDGRYRLADLDENGIYTSATAAGLRLRASWLWQRPLPTLTAALADLPA